MESWSTATVGVMDVRQGSLSMYGSMRGRISDGEHVSVYWRIPQGSARIMLDFHNSRNVTFQIKHMWCDSLA